MSRNRPAKASKLDRRVRRTRDRLGDALVELMVEKPFEEITVQQVLDRAGVARSTFYSHFRDTNDLLLSDADEFLELMATRLARTSETSDRLVAVRELFAHVAGSRDLYDALVAAGRMQDFLDLAREHFARAIEGRLGELPRARALAPERRPALAQGLAGALLSLLDWWIVRPDPAPPEEMDQLFHTMAWSGVEGASGP